MPAPSASGRIADQGTELFSLVSDGGTALAGFFPDEPRLRENAYAQGLDLSTGALTNRLETPSTQVLETTPQRMWGLSSPDPEGVVAIDVRSGQTVRHWSSDVLADADDDRSSPVAIAASQGTSFVLSFGRQVSLAAVDPDSDQPRWVRSLGITAPSSYSSAPNQSLTAHAGEAYVAVEDRRLPGVRVIRVDATGHVRARAAIVMPGVVLEPVLVAGPEGVYLSMTFDGLQKHVGSAYLLRLDRSTLALHAKRLLAGYAEPGRIGLGLWTETIACSSRLLSEYDPVTLTVTRTYDVHPESTESMHFDFTPTGLVIAFKKEYEDDEVIVERYKRL